MVGFCVEMFGFCTKNVRFCIENVGYCRDLQRRGLHLQVRAPIIAAELATFQYRFLLKKRPFQLIEIRTLALVITLSSLYTNDEFAFKMMNSVFKMMNSIFKMASQGRRGAQRLRRNVQLLDFF